MRRSRHQLAAVMVVLALGSIIAVHHSGVAMGSMHQGMNDGGTAAVMAVCAGVLLAVGAAVVAVAVGSVGLGRWRLASDRFPTGMQKLVGLPEPRARAGPVVLAFLCRSLR